MSPASPTPLIVPQPGRRARDLFSQTGYDGLHCQGGRVQQGQQGGEQFSQSDVVQRPDDRQWQGRVHHYQHSAEQYSQSEHVPGDRGQSERVPGDRGKSEHVPGDRGGDRGQSGHVPGDRGHHLGRVHNQARGVNVRPSAASFWQSSDQLN